MGKVKTQYTILMADFNPKVGKKTGDHRGGIMTLAQNNRGEILLEFAEANYLRISNISTNGRTEIRHRKGRMAILNMK